MISQYYVIHVMVILHPGHLIWRENCRDWQATKSEPTRVKLNILKESNNHRSENTKIRNKQLKPLKGFEMYRRERQKGQKTGVENYKNFFINREREKN